MSPNIQDYYEQLAPKYDDERFGNSYGRFIDRQEKAVLRKWLQGRAPERCLDLGCGTGRLLEFAETGLDASPAMIRQAALKYPRKHLQVGNALHTPFPDDSFQTILSFHLIMHLNQADTEALWRETHRLLRPGGWFIFDVPSQKRRRLSGYRAENWHGANSFSLQMIDRLAAGAWTIHATNGILFLPIHRVPNWARAPLLPVDATLCRSSFKEWASYLIIAMVKR